MHPASVTTGRLGRASLVQAAFSYMETLRASSKQGNANTGCRVFADMEKSAHSSMEMETLETPRPRRVRSNAKRQPHRSIEAAKATAVEKAVIHRVMTKSGGLTLRRNSSEIKRLI